MSLLINILFSFFGGLIIGFAYLFLKKKYIKANTDPYDVTCGDNSCMCARDYKYDQHPIMQSVEILKKDGVIVECVDNKN